MRNKKTFEMALASTFSAIIILFGLVPFLGYVTVGIISVTTIHVIVLIASVIMGRKYAWFFGLVFGLTSMYVAYTRPSGIFDVYFQNPLVSVLPRVVFAALGYEIYNFIVVKKRTDKQRKILSYSIASIVGLLILSYVIYMIKNPQVFGDIEINVYLIIVFIIIAAFLLVFLMSFSKIIKRLAKNKFSFDGNEEDREYLYTAVSFTIATLIHSIAVLTMLYLFAYLDSNMSSGFFTFIASIFAINGLIEVLIAILVGVPVSTRVLKYYKSEYGDEE